MKRWENASFVEKMVKTWLCFQPTTKNWVESWSVGSAGKNSGMEIVWYVAPLGQAAPAQAVDEEESIPQIVEKWNSSTSGKINKRMV